VVLANDTQDEISLELEVGYVSLDGTLADLKTCTVDAAPLARTELCVFERGEHDPARGLWIARAVDHVEIKPAIYRALDYRQLATIDPQLRCSVTERQENQCTVQVSTRGYAHAVQIQLPVGAQPCDNYFDLVPGESREIQVISSGPLDATEISVTCVNAV
jgi:hypothetical protein